MIQTNQQNAPKLRFPKFEGDWILVPLSERVASIKSGRTKHADSGDFPVYGSTGLIGFTDTAEFEGDNLLVARVGANAGRINRADGRYGVTDNTLVVTPTDRIDLGFLEASLRLFNLNRLVFGSGQPLVTGTMLKRLKRAFPTLPEQQKIACFLGTLDKKIEQLSEKKRLLDEFKKGCMQQLFSREIRFTVSEGKNFPDWEEKPLIEVAHKTASSISAGSLENSPGEYPVYGASGVIGHVNYFASDEPHVGVVKDGAGVGRLFFCPPKSSVLGTLESITATGTNNTKFVYYWMSQIDFVAYTTGSTVPHVYFKDYGQMKGFFPHPDEQRKIANFLSTLDTKIDLASQELALAQTFKKGLLQQMFV